jgi:hypothetical protein
MYIVSPSSIITSHLIYDRFLRILKRLTKPVSMLEPLLDDEIGWLIRDLHEYA